MDIAHRVEGSDGHQWTLAGHAPANARCGVLFVPARGGPARE
jgi:hypothetical protein